MVKDRMKFDLGFYKNKNVFITGHTGFKGSWLCQLLLEHGANVTGYSLLPSTNPSLFEILNMGENMHSIIGDIRDYESLKKAFDVAQPEFVFHLAAQPIVLEGYKHPRYTYEVNVMGTVNILECVRGNETVRSFLNVTTDKVYRNKEWEWGYRENEELKGYDPYSNSKSCSELVTYSYRKSFLNLESGSGVAISTARAGNVIGGGDFAADRIVPDCVRAAISHENIIVRNRYSVQPYQHVLEPLYVYLMIAAMQRQDCRYAGCYNVGPDEGDCIQTGDLVDLFVKCWGDGLKWESVPMGTEAPHEANFLKLDCSKLKRIFDWKPRWNIEAAIEKTVAWSKCYIDCGDIHKCMHEQIADFLA